MIWYKNNKSQSPLSTNRHSTLQGPHSAQLGAASFFGFVSMLVYGLDAVLKFRGWRAGQLAQGERKVTQTFASPTIRGGHWGSDLADTGTYCDLTWILDCQSCHGESDIITIRCRSTVLCLYFCKSGSRKVFNVVILMILDGIQQLACICNSAYCACA